MPQIHLYFFVMNSGLKELKNFSLIGNVYALRKLAPVIHDAQFPIHFVIVL